MTNFTTIYSHRPKRSMTLPIIIITLISLQLECLNPNQDYSKRVSKILQERDSLRNKLTDLKQEKQAIQEQLKTANKSIESLKTQLPGDQRVSELQQQVSQQAKALIQRVMWLVNYVVVPLVSLALPTYAFELEERAYPLITVQYFLPGAKFSPKKNYCTLTKLIHSNYIAMGYKVLRGHIFKPALLPPVGEQPAAVGGRTAEGEGGDGRGQW